MDYKETHISFLYDDLVITYLIKEIQIYPKGESEQLLKSIEINFPIYRDGQEVRRLLWEKGNTVESIVLLSKLADDHMELEIDPLELEKIVDRVPAHTPKLSSTF